MVHGSWFMVLLVAALGKSGKAERMVNGSWFFASKASGLERMVLLVAQISQKYTDILQKPLKTPC